MYDIVDGSYDGRRVDDKVVAGWVDRRPLATATLPRYKSLYTEIMSVFSTAVRGQGMYPVYWGPLKRKVQMCLVRKAIYGSWYYTDCTVK